MSFFAFSGLINFLTSFLTGLFVLLQSPKSERNITFSFFCLAMSVWSLFYFLWQVAGDAHSAHSFCKGLMMGAIFIPLFLYHSVLAFLGPTTRSRKPLYAGYAICIFLALFNISNYIVAGIEQRSIFKYWPIPGPLFHIHLLIFAFLLIKIILVLLSNLKTATGIMKQQIQFLLIGSIVGFGGGMTNYPLWYNIPIIPYGNILVSIYVWIIVYNIVRNNFLDINLAFRYATIYSLLACTLGIPVLAVGWLTKSWIVSSFFGLATTLFSPWLIMKVKEKLTSAVDQLPPFKKYADRISKLHFLEERILDCGSTDECTQATISSIADYFSVDSAHVLTWDASTRCFQPQAVFGSKKELPDELSLPPENELVLALKSERRILIREILERSGGESEQKVAEIMRMLGAEITAPVLLNNRLVSIINMGPKPGQEMYNELDLGDLFRLARTQAQALRGLHLESEKQSYAKAWMRAEDKATRDPLTHLYNRSKIKDYLGESLETASHRGTPVSVLLLDIDHFKRINDTFGHPAGDEVIKALAGLIDAALGDREPKKHAAGRLGGEEFLLVLNQTDKPGAADFAGRLLDQARKMELTVAPGKTIRFTVSIGVSSYPEDGGAPIDLIRTADELMYQAKESGRDRVAVASRQKSKAPSQG